MNTDLHPLAAPFPPLQRVGLFAAASVRALAEFSHLNAAARECVTQMGVRDRALSGALRNDIARVPEYAATARAPWMTDDDDPSLSLEPDRAAVKCAMECEALAGALLPAARQLGIDAAQVELLFAFREFDFFMMPRSWSLATPLAQWHGVTLNACGSVTKIDVSETRDMTGHVDLTKLPATLTMVELSYNALEGRVDLTRLPPTLAVLHLGHNQLEGTIDLTQLPETLTELYLFCNRLSGPIDLTALPATMTRLRLGDNKLSGHVDLSKLPAALTELYLSENPGLTGLWRGGNRREYYFGETGIKEQAGRLRFKRNTKTIRFARG
jgi:hypothetical protein